MDCIARRVWSTFWDRRSWFTTAFWTVVNADRRITIAIERTAIATTSSANVKPDWSSDRNLLIARVQHHHHPAAGGCP